MPFLVAFSGNVGSGKTTLAREVCAALGWSCHLETPERNPYLLDALHDPGEWAFQSEMWFLLRKFESLSRSATQPSVVERTLEEDHIFAKLLLSVRDYSLYREWHDHVKARTPEPNLIVYLEIDTETALERIRTRGLPADQSIERPFLDNLGALIEQWILTCESSDVIRHDPGQFDGIDDSASHLADRILKAYETVAV